MIYDLFIEFCGIPEDLLLNNYDLQAVFACGAVALAVLVIYLIVYMFIVIFRGWR